jgi:hypothetical protein
LKTLRSAWPVIVIATTSGTPAPIRFVTAEWQVSWNTTPHDLELLTNEHDLVRLPLPRVPLASPMGGGLAQGGRSAVDRRRVPRVP